MKNFIPFSITFSLLWLGLIGQSGTITFAQSTTLSADGVYVPRLTTAKRDAIASPANGQMVYNTDDGCFNVYQKDSWQKLCGFDMKTTDVWTKKADFAGGIRQEAVGFSIGNKGYIGTGYNYYSNIHAKDFWEYNPITNVWTQKADFGGPVRQEAFGFSIGNKGYVGAGRFAYTDYTDFWEYDPDRNEWAKKADFAGGVRQQAVGFSIGNKGYIGTGVSYSSGKYTYYKDFWEYDPENNVWIQKTDFEGVARREAVGFSIGNKGFLGTGGLGEEGNTLKDFWEYNPTDIINGLGTDNKPKGSWIRKKDLASIGRYEAVGFSINNKGYIGTGLIDAYAPVKEFWEFDPNTSNITQQGNFFNGENQLVQTDQAGKVPITVLPAVTTTQGNEFNAANKLLKLDASGFLGVGVSSPKAYIHLPNLVTNRKIILWQEIENQHQFFGFGISPAELRYQVDAPHSSHVFYAGNGASASTVLFTIKGTGGACLNGNMVSTGASCTSDIRYKTNFSSIDNPLDKILKMNGFQYYWRTEQFKEKNFPETRQIGFIAQEVEALFPELVNTDEKGYKSVDYARLTPVLVEAIKELKKENNDIRKDIETLKSMILQAHNGK